MALEKASSIYLPLASAAIGALASLVIVVFSLGGEWSKWKEIREAYDRDEWTNVPGPDVSNMVTTDQLPDFASFARVESMPDFSMFALSDSLPEFSSFATTSELAEYVKLDTLPDFSGFASKSDVSRVENQVPSGTVVAWFGPGDVPQGWAICNGDNGTPDLRGLFLRGVGTLGEMGVDPNATDSHGHSASSRDPSENANMVRAGTSHGNDDSWWSLVNHTHAISVGGSSHIPPNYRVVYIMKL